VVVLAPVAMTVIALIGVTTALFAALVSLTQSDIKRVLAYSTISQLGFMILACGVGAFVAAIFHLLAHGFLKAFLFLSTGNVLASTHPRHVASSTERDPSTVKPLFTGALLLSVIPPFVLFSGPYERLWLTSSFTAAGVAFWVLALATVFFTAMYLLRSILSLFHHGPPAGRGGGESSSVRPHLLSPPHLAGVIGATLVSAAALIALWTWMAGFLSPAVGGAPPAGATTVPSSWILVPLAVALAGFAWAYALYRRSTASLLARSERTAWLYVFFLKKGYFDEIYDSVVVHPTLRLARWLWRTVDARGIDRVVVGAGTFTVSFSRWLWRFLDMGGITRGVESFARRVLAIGRALQEIEPRTLQQNLLVMIFWLVAAIGFFYWIV
jgi:NADH-quinone oxidoreductase subunit L